MPKNEDLHRQLRRTEIMMFGFVVALVFGGILLIAGDWIPGGIIVAANVVALAVYVPILRKLRSGAAPPTVKPTSHSR